MYHLNLNQGHYFLHGFMNKSHLDTIHENVLHFCKLIRQQAVPLVDSFNLSDRVINSAIGGYDGNVYPEYMRLVTRGKCHYFYILFKKKDLT